MVKGNDVIFSHYRAENFYYNIVDGDEISGITICYQFPVPIDDTGNATMLARDKAVTYMRWIRKALDENTLLSVL